MDISKMTIEQLKALAYDQLIELQRIQSNLQLIESQIKLLKEKEDGSTTTKNTK